MKRDRWYILLFSVLAVLLIGFIFHNSMQDADTSHSRSSHMLALLSTVLPFLTEHIVRKLAHFCEYAALGWDFYALSVYVRRYARPRLAPFLTFCALIPCADEFLQLFSPGRSAAFRDVCLDWSGMLCGALVAALMYLALRRCLSSRRHG